jgi:integrase
MALTTRKVLQAKQPGRYADGQGLYLQINPSGAGFWLLRYERYDERPNRKGRRRERWMGLGPASEFTLLEARERARAQRQKLRDGIDPIDARNAERGTQRTEAARAKAKEKTFEECAEQYFNFHAPKWRNAKHRAQFLSTLKQYAYPVLGRLPVAAIDNSLVLKCVQPIWQSKNETASRVRGRIEAVLDYAKVNGWRDGANPAAWNSNLEHALPAPGTIVAVKHHAALPFAELPAFMVQLRERDAVAARALEFLILTAARTGEVIEARWSEFDLRAGVWTIPASRMKAKKEHRVPLCARALAILKALPRESEFVFIGTRPNTAISNMAMAQLLKRMNRTAITVHGFRSTFRDWAAERTNYPNHVVEMALAHVIGDKVEAAYRRGDLFAKRERLMIEWARYCAQPPTVTAGNVTPLRAGA